jgi:hypothetical protein
MTATVRPRQVGGGDDAYARAMEALDFCLRRYGRALRQLAR